MRVGSVIAIALMCLEAGAKERESGGFWVGPNKRTLDAYPACLTEEQLSQFREAERTGDVELAKALLNEGCIQMRPGVHATALELVSMFPPVAKVRLYNKGVSMEMFAPAIAIVSTRPTTRRWRSDEPRNFGLLESSPSRPRRGRGQN